MGINRSNASYAKGCTASMPWKKKYSINGNESLQVSVQALPRRIYNKKTIIFLVDNDDYKIKRYIMGIKRDYNYISKWDSSLLPQAFSKAGTGMKTAEVKSQD